MKLNHWHDVRDWYRGFLDAGLRADVVPLAYDWTGYKTIVLPTVLSLSDEDVSVSPTSRRPGGTVIVGYAAGLIDEHFHIGLGGYPGAGNGLLRDMLGIRSEEFNILGEEAEGEPSEISLSNGLTTRLWQNDVTSVAADTQCLPLTQVSPPPTGSWSVPPPSPAAPMATVPPSTWAATSTVTTLPSCSKHLAPDGRSCRRSRLRVVKLQPIPPQIPASCTPSADPQTAPLASISTSTAQTSPSPSTVWKVIPSSPTVARLTPLDIR